MNLPESSATHSLDEAKESNCSICNTRLRRAKGHPYRVTEEMIRFFATENIFLNADNFICEKDYKRFHKSSKKATDGKSKFEFEEEEETEVTNEKNVKNVKNVSKMKFYIMRKAILIFFVAEKGTTNFTK